VPNYARCPQCNAAVPHRADWCSLCHADLRPVPVATTVDTPPATHGPASHRAAGTPAHAAVGGRHRRVEEAPEVDPTSGAEPVSAPEAPTAPPVGRHAAGRTSVALADDIDALVADAPVDAEGKPDLEALTNQLMARLQSSESRSSAIPDVDAVPGGKWGLLVGGMVAIATVLVLIMAAAGKLLG
jgi:hypothetical protein